MLRPHPLGTKPQLLPLLLGLGAAAVATLGDGVVTAVAFLGGGAVAADSSLGDGAPVLLRRPMPWAYPWGHRGSGMDGRDYNGKCVLFVSISQLLVIGDTDKDGAAVNGGVPIPPRDAGSRQEPWQRPHQNADPAPMISTPTAPTAVLPWGRARDDPPGMPGPSCGDHEIDR